MEKSIEEKVIQLQKKKLSAAQEKALLKKEEREQLKLDVIEFLFSDWGEGG